MDVEIRAHLKPSAAYPGRLTGDAVMLYRFAIANPDWTPICAAEQLGMTGPRVRDAIVVLASFRLLRPAVDPVRGWDAVGPETALAELLAHDEAELHHRQARVARIRGEIMCLLPTYFEARQARRHAEAIDVIRDVPAVRTLLAECSRQADREVRVAHPGSGLCDEALERSLQLDTAVLRRGVAMRVVLQHCTRYHLPTRRYVQAVGQLGAEVRTVPVVPRKLIVFDQEVAFLPLEGGEPERGAAVAREPAVVDNLCATFDLFWTAGRPFPVEQPNSLEESRDELWQAILDYMAVGAKDDLIARQLGLSVRTCRRHIAAIMEKLGATSRFQAGMLAQQRRMFD